MTRHWPVLALTPPQSRRVSGCHCGARGGPEDIARHLAEVGQR